MKKTIFTSDAPAPIGPYSQAVLANGILYASGQIAINPTTNELVMDTIQNETLQVMQNMKAVLAAAEMDFENIVKCSIFISDMGNFNEINEVYATFFTENPPARETVEVSCLPKNVNVEISFVAVK